MSSAGGESTTTNLQRVSQVTFLATAWSATVLSLLFLAFRLAVRIQSFRRLQSDDWLVISAWVMLLAFTIAWQVEAYFLYWMYDVSNGKALPTEAFFNQYTTFLRFVVVWNYLFYSGLWAVKLSFLIFFRRLGSKTKSHRIWWWVVLLLTIGGWFGCIADIDYRCTLGDMNYIFTVCPTPSHINWQNHTFYGNMAADVITDVLILSIPVIILWNVQIPWRNKIILFGVFSATMLIITISVIRVALVKGTQQQLKEPAIDWLYLWSAVEMATSIAVASVGSFRQLFLSKKQPQLGQRSSSYGSQRVWLFKGVFSRFTRDSSKANYQNDSLEDLSNTSSDFNKVTQDDHPQRCVAPLKAVHVQMDYEVTSAHTTPAPWVDGPTSVFPSPPSEYDHGGYHQGNYTWAR